MQIQYLKHTNKIYCDCEIFHQETVAAKWLHFHFVFIDVVFSTVRRADIFTNPCMIQYITLYVVYTLRVLSVLIFHMGICDWPQLICLNLFYCNDVCCHATGE